MPEISTADGNPKPVPEPEVPTVRDRPSDGAPQFDVSRSQWRDAVYGFAYVGIAQTTQAGFDPDGIAVVLPLYVVCVAAAGLTEALARRLAHRLTRRGVTVAPIIVSRRHRTRR
ncbi:hypothetical protein OG948_50300 (plasmid) [Embleya sp. NBC_00888]|uniref:hypothetical protein n=1 Tax=Embleya sp. NBC_00888 TaxID=2975960 RepID=UPI002F91A8FD|nr:hypothetical protein OG948_50300 [Embleya sp. NBC_00888]